MKKKEWTSYFSERTNYTLRRFPYPCPRCGATLLGKRPYKYCVECKWNEMT